MMTQRSRPRVDYDGVASSYDQRFAYPAGERRGVADALVRLAGDTGAKRILEVGCGTGRWLAILKSEGRDVYGLDPSVEMLRRAQERSDGRHLVRGRANGLPFASATFDLIFCVSALHHFDDPAAFVQEARFLLRPGGALAVIGMNPHSKRDRWYLYDYFEGTYETDVRRYPSSGALSDWMISSGFDAVEWRVAERLQDTRVGENVLDDPMLKKNATSVLTPLTDSEYEAGLGRVRAAATTSTAAGEKRAFSVDISLVIVTARLSA